VIAIKEKFYITTTIPYANAPPHIGFALEIVQADVLARWNRLNGKDVFFLTGTDEHGIKNYQAAKKAGLSPQDFVDKNSADFKKLTKVLNISNTNFIRTSDKKNHWPGVIELWKKLAGDIYKKKYKGLYCKGCERFVTEKDLEGGKCPDHPNLKIEKIAEENYFFKLSKYSDKIRELIEKDEIKIIPTKWKNDFLGLIKDGLTDVSFSRDKKHLPWGIPVLGDDKQICYVWVEALGNYLTGIGYPDKKFKKYWPADIHVVGKDMLRFHAGIWPGMLLSAGLPLPKQVVVHGFLTVGGHKMSKSRGNVVAPLELVKKYKADSIRYFLIREIPFDDDGDFSESELIERHNNELIANYGNLFYRVTSFINQNFTSVPSGTEDGKLKKKLAATVEIVEKKMEQLKLHEALKEIMHLSAIVNKYFQDGRPWVLRQRDSSNLGSSVEDILYNAVNVLGVITKLLYPFIPETAGRCMDALGLRADNKFEYCVKAGTKIKAFVPFTKIEIKEGSKKNDQTENGQTKNNKEQDAKLELKAETIVSVKDHPDADTLYVLKLESGRQLVAGLKGIRGKEELMGKRITVVNLEKKKLRGVESDGMLIATEDATLIVPEKSMVLKGSGRISIKEFEKYKMEVKDSYLYVNGKKMAAKTEKPVKMARVK
jgi:methionyl-tRNA synthetase